MMNYNADRRDLFTRVGLQVLQDLKFSAADLFALKQMEAELKFFQQQLLEADRQLREFAKQAPVREQQLRELLLSIPGVGTVTTEVVLAEIADIDRFDSQKEVVAYAGLAPGQRESAGRSRELHIEKTGSKHLRWVLVEAAWRLIRHSPRWQAIYERLKVRLRAKKAVVAIARRLLTVMTAILKSGEPFSAAHVAA